jgi:hypothetical protein
MALCLVLKGVIGISDKKKQRYLYFQLLTENQNASLKSLLSRTRNYRHNVQTESKQKKQNKQKGPSSYLLVAIQYSCV